MTKVFRFVLLASFVTALTGCETMAVLTEGNSTALAPDAGMAMLSARVENMEDFACTLILTSDDGSISYSLPLPKRATPKVYAVKAGTYKFLKVNCPGRRTIFTSDALPYAVKVNAGSLSVVGDFLMRYDSSLDEALLLLTDGKKALRKEFHDALVNQKIPAISAYNSKPITPAMYDGEGESIWSWQSSFDAQEDPKVNASQVNMDGLGTCAVREAKRNPLRLGTLEFNAVFLGSRLDKIQAGPNESAYSDEYLACVKGVIEGVKIQAKGTTKLNVRLN